MKNIHVIRTGGLAVNTLVVPVGEKKCFVVDPAACSISRDETVIVDYLKKEKLECTGIVLTHSHFDHITGIAPVKQAFPKAPVLIHQAEFDEMQNPPGPMGSAVISLFGISQFIPLLKQQPPAEIPLVDGQTLECIEAPDWKVIHTPGHTPGSICLYNEKEGLLISGDTLFDEGGYGRTDMAGGDYNLLMKSLTKIHSTIPAGTKVYPGHESYCFVL